METLILWFGFFLSKVCRRSPGGLWQFSPSPNYNKCTSTNILSQPDNHHFTFFFNVTYMQTTLQIFVNIGNILNVMLLQMSIHYDKNVSYLHAKRLELWLSMCTMIIICWKQNLGRRSYTMSGHSMLCNILLKMSVMHLSVLLWLMLSALSSKRDSKALLHTHRYKQRQTRSDSQTGSQAKIQTHTTVQTREWRTQGDRIQIWAHSWSNDTKGKSFIIFLNVTGTH